MTQYSQGAASVALGASALVFARMRLKRIAKEKGLIKQMWESHTTVRGLRMAAEAGEALPETVMVRGWLSARGPPVQSLAARVPQLSERLGTINQPENLFLKLAEKVKSGEVEAPKDIKEWSVHARYHDDFSSTQRAPADNLLVRELLVTRLGCEALRKEKVDDKGNEEVTITRKPRKARFNVFHDRAVAEGLHVLGLQGEAADLELPSYDERELRANDAPSLFLSAPDAMNEFKRWSRVNVVNADKALTHLSRFVHLDRSSQTDNGAFHGKPSGESADAKDIRTSSGVSVRTADLEGVGALAALGALRPSGWLWNGKGFYDNNSREQSWMSHYGTALVDYTEYATRLATAREENCRYQKASEWSYDTMQARRDEENCFRFVELGISASEVVVVAKPHYEGFVGTSQKPTQQLLSERASATEQNAVTASAPQGRIVLRSPEKKGVGDAQFEFRILKGHTAEQLLNHRDVSIQIFVGFALMGLATIAVGEEMMRDSVEVVDLL